MGKFALRALAQSTAREFGPQGIHVAHIIIDGQVDLERSIKVYHHTFSQGRSPYNRSLTPGNPYRHRKGVRWTRSSAPTPSQRSTGICTHSTRPRVRTAPPMCSFTDLLHEPVNTNTTSFPYTQGRWRSTSALMLLSSSRPWSFKQSYRDLPRSMAAVMKFSKGGRMAELV